MMSAEPQEPATADETSPQSRDRPVRPPTPPWAAVLAGLLASAWLLLLSDPAMLAFYQPPPVLLGIQARYGVLVLLILVVIIDLARHHYQRARMRRDIQHQRERMQALWDSRKQLQRKAHIYSDHADKLKRFISDKLLEYIEYDEKFLHFKSIAAEVRHNGVISFDKVLTALEQAADERQIREARASMRYLWDLLDLSTTDNLALYIGNGLCEAEEQYYQQLLNADENTRPPFNPVFPPLRAAWRALAQVSEAALPEPEPGRAYHQVDNHRYVHLKPVPELLGNENHLVLMLENLLKNASFFSRKRGYTSPFAPIALTLEEDAGQARFRVYNRGPHLEENDRQNLYQLGFSTRRAREHHGRGLGLYFVNEIVKGYEGRIQVHNVHTPQARYALRIELASGEVFTELVEVKPERDRPLCRLPGDEWQKTLLWPLRSPLHSVEVTAADSDAGGDTWRLAEFTTRGKQNRFDPAHPERPRWRLGYQPKGQARGLEFEPLEIGGVEFEIHLPTARQRLEHSEALEEADIDAEVERLDAHFRARSPEE